MEYEITITVQEKRPFGRSSRETYYSESDLNTEALLLKVANECKYLDKEV